MFNYNKTIKMLIFLKSFFCTNKYVYCERIKNNGHDKIRGKKQALQKEKGTVGGGYINTMKTTFYFNFNLNQAV